MIKGKLINLIPATLQDRQNVYEWCFHSETTKSHSGLPKYPNNPIPTFEEFCEDYADYYFTGSSLHDGRGFIIMRGEEQLGFISYASFHVKQNKSELDIWLNCEANCGKGFGTDAVVSLGNYLNEIQGIDELIIRPSAKNTRAVKSYKKAGFVEFDGTPDYYLLDEYVSLYGDGDYGAEESMLLVKKF